MDVNVMLMIASLGIFAIVLVRYYIHWFQVCKRLGASGPLPVPFFGHLPYSIRPGILIFDNHVVRKYGKVIPTLLGWKVICIVADSDVLRQLQVRDFQSFYNRGSPTILPYPFSLNLLQLEDERWKHVRSVITPTFTSGKLKHIFPLIMELADDTLQTLQAKFEANEHVDLKKLFGLFTSGTISSIAFGLDIVAMPVQERLRLTKLYDDAIGMARNGNWRILAMTFLPFVSFKADNEGKSALSLVPSSKLEEILQLLEHVYSERMSGVRRIDFFQMMLEARLGFETAGSNEGSASDSDANSQTLKGNDKKAKLSKAELFSQATVFLFAGYETTMTSLSYAACALAQYPDVQEKCFREIDAAISSSPEKVLSYELVNNLTYLDATFKESMRLFTPVRRFMRICTKDTQISGIEFHRGDLIVIPAHAIHRLTDYWGSDADTFNPDRFFERPQADFAFQTFGAGQRSCIGERLAMLEAKALLAVILHKYKFVPGPLSVLPPKADSPAIFMRSPHDLLLKVEPR